MILSVGSHAPVENEKNEERLRKIKGSALLNLVLRDFSQQGDVALALELLSKDAFSRSKRHVEGYARKAL